MAKLSFQRIIVFVMAGIILVLTSFEIIPNLIGLGAILILLFLGVTNYGRQCPVVLSIKRIIHKIKSKESK